ncbi:uncharacterized protein LOC141803291 [Halichoeres trimaculatus]|uniref:uncharacterized protein LOC141803291 n=1 Tax=Halichoeres trimaculatus TaxID=147232 RepID=UPI003D9EB716
MTYFSLGTRIRETGTIVLSAVQKHLQFILLYCLSVFHDFTPCLLHLLLLAELFVLSSSHPVHRSPLCGMFTSMSNHLDKVLFLSPQLHDLTEDELSKFEGVEHKLQGLPLLNHTAEHFTALQVNKSLSQLFVDTESFRLHVNWLKTAKENLSLPSQPAEGTSSHLHQLSNLIKGSLQHISEEVPPSPSASLPAVSSAFEALQYSFEISERLQVFARWTKRVLRLLGRQSRCPRH